MEFRSCSSIPSNRCSQKKLLIFSELRALAIVLYAPDYFRVQVHDEVRSRPVCVRALSLSTWTASDMNFWPIMAEILGLTDGTVVQKDIFRFQEVKSLQ